MNNLEFKALNAAVRGVLFNDQLSVPAHWYELPSELKDEWLEAHSRVPKTGQSYLTLRDQVNYAYLTNLAALESLIVDMEDCLIEAAVRDEIPTDFNQLNLTHVFEEYAS